MAITTIDIQEKDKSVTEHLGLKVDNGDYQALTRIVEASNLKDIPSALRFAIAVLAKGGEKGVYVDEDGDKIRLVPGDSLLKEETTQEDNRK